MKEEKDKPVDSEPAFENPSSDESATEAEQLITHNSELITNEMEVHHHAHTDRKKWSHYFWEFLMLFLAVFCGFFAEYQLEHKIERDKEKQFINSLVKDIQADIGNLKNIIENRNSRQSSLDSLMNLLNSNNKNKMGNSIYFNAVHMGRRMNIRFTANDGTMQQLKNAGGLRLIGKRNVVDSISKYDVSSRNLLTLGELEDVIIQDYRTTEYKIFDPLVFEKMLDEENNTVRPTDNPTLLPFDKNNLNEINAKLHTAKLLNRSAARDAKLLLKQATNLLNTLKKEYRLK